MDIIRYIENIAAGYGLEFMRPLYLRYLWGIPLIWAVSVFASKRLTFPRLILALVLRTTLYTLLLLALAGLSLKKEISRPSSVIAAVDISDSMGDAGKEWAIAQAKKILDSSGEETEKGRILFARGSEMRNPVAKEVGGDWFTPVIPTEATDIASAVMAAAPAFPASGPKRLLIFSDGNENSGDARTAAGDAAREQIRIDCFSPPGHVEGKPQLTKLDLPEEVNVSEKFVVRMIAANSGRETQELSLALRDGEALIKEWTVAVQPGTNAFELPYSIVSPGTHRITASLSAPGSTEPVTGTASISAPVFVVDRPKALCLSGSREGRNFLSEALSTKEIDLQVGGAEIIPAKMEDLLAYDCVVLSNFPRASLGKSAMAMLSGYVREHGGGLIMLGGANSFGPGGYGGTPIEEVLPVKMGKGIPFEKEKTVRLCIILLIDKSGSMGIGFGGKITAARRAAEELVKQLQSNDMVGIIPFDSRPFVIVPLGAVDDNQASIINRIRLIHPGGGTIISTPMAEALREMREVEGKAKHVILLTDGQTADMRGVRAYNYRGLISEFAQSGVSISTVGIGGDADQDFLRAISLGTGGNFYYVKDASTLPLIVLQDTRNALEKSGFLEDTIMPRMGEKSQMLRGISQDQIPRLLGYVITTAKPRADVVLYTDVRKLRDPILASWRVGLGKAVAFTSDAEARWSKEMVSWRMFSKFWTQVLRWTMRERPSDYYLVRAREEGGRHVLELQTFGTVSDECSFRIIPGTASGGEKRTVHLHQIAPETYAGEVGTLSPDMDAVTVEKVEGGKVVSRKEVALIRRISSSASSPEKSVTGTNKELLTTIARETEGLLNPPADDLTFPPEKVHTTRSLNLWLFPCLFLLLLADIALRKFS